MNRQIHIAYLVPHNRLRARAFACSPRRRFLHAQMQRRLGAYDFGSRGSIPSRALVSSSCNSSVRLRPAKSVHDIRWQHVGNAARLNVACSLENWPAVPVAKGTRATGKQVRILPTVFDRVSLIMSRTATYPSAKQGRVAPGI